MRLIVSADIVNRDDQLPVGLALQLVDTDPGNLLAVRTPASPRRALLSGQTRRRTEPRGGERRG